MSKPPTSEEKAADMALSLASGVPGGRCQALPSFREVRDRNYAKGIPRPWLTCPPQLLPPHLHEEIDSSPFSSSSLYYSSSADATSRSQSGRSPVPPVQPSLSLGDGLRDFSLRPERFGPGQSGGGVEGRPSRQTSTGRPSPPYAASATPQWPSRGPSPILPPLRDLHSLPERNLNQRASFSRESDHQQFPNIQGNVNRATVDSARYISSSYDGPRQSPYSGAPLYRSETEYPSPMHNPPSSSFGVLGEPMDSRGKRRRGNLPKPVTDILRAWFHEHLDHPYPSEEDKQMFITRTGLSMSQVRSHLGLGF